MSTARQLRWSSRRTLTPRAGNRCAWFFSAGFSSGGASIPFGLVVELDDVAVGIAAAEGRPVPDVAVDPADVEARSLQRGDAALQRLRAAGAQRHVLHA